MSSLPTLHALLIDEIKDLYFAENQLVKALPKMAKAATNPDLKKGFTHHLAQTRGHVTRLARSLKILGVPAKGKTCHAMLGLVKEGAEAIQAKGPVAVRDAALIGAAQRVEHYEMAGYGTARSFARILGENQVADLLQTTLDEEGETNKKLSEIADKVNDDALAAGGKIPGSKKSRK
ncbi:MAG TPA: ferritin-like domain-containing protein [Opitutaceae bacterium]|jgi:ferritin-like metal-binding protein YciE|nr:ferritin-like domain-containing protein [Opitutaceae bacterium]